MGDLLPELLPPVGRLGATDPSGVCWVSWVATHAKAMEKQKKFEQKPIQGPLIASNPVLEQ